MKSVTLLSLSLAALVGTACSEAKTETAEAPAEVVKASAPADDGFNLPSFKDGVSDTLGESEFNLRGDIPSGTMVDDGFNLGGNLSLSDSALNQIPDVDTSLLEESDPLGLMQEDEIVQPEVVDEDEIIRLD